MAEISLSVYQHKIDDLLEKNRFNEVIAHCRHILKEYPKNLKAYNQLGHALFHASRWEETAEVFRRLLGAIPHDYDAHIHLSGIYEHMGQFDEAIWHAERAYDQQPNHSDVILQIRKLYQEHRGRDVRRLQLTAGAVAQQHIRNELYAQAISVLNKALQRYPNRVDLQILQARALWLMGKELDAAEIAVDVLAILPYSLVANRILTDLWLSEQRPSDAQRYLSRIEELDPYLAYRLATGETPSESLIMLNELDYDRLSRQELTMANPDWLSSIGSDDASQDEPASDDFDVLPDLDFDSETADDAVGDEADLLDTLFDEEADVDLNALFEDMDDTGDVITPEAEPAEADWLNELDGLVEEDDEADLDLDALFSENDSPDIEVDFEDQVEAEFDFTDDEGFEDLLSQQMASQQPVSPPRKVTDDLEDLLSDEWQAQIDDLEDMESELFGDSWLDEELDDDELEDIISDWGDEDNLIADDDDLEELFGKLEDADDDPTGRRETARNVKNQLGVLELLLKDTSSLTERDVQGSMYIVDRLLKDTSSLGIQSKLLNDTGGLQNVDPHKKLEILTDLINNTSSLSQRDLQEKLGVLQSLLADTSSLGMSDLLQDTSSLGMDSQVNELHERDVQSKFDILDRLLNDTSSLTQQDIQSSLYLIDNLLQDTSALGYQSDVLRDTSKLELNDPHKKLEVLSDLLRNTGNLAPQDLRTKLEALDALLDEQDRQVSIGGDSLLRETNNTLDDEFEEFDLIDGFDDDDLDVDELFGEIQDEPTMMTGELRLPDDAPTIRGSDLDTGELNLPEGMSKEDLPDGLLDRIAKMKGKSQDETLPATTSSPPQKGEDKKGLTGLLSQLDGDDDDDLSWLDEAQKSNMVTGMLDLPDHLIDNTEDDDASGMDFFDGFEDDDEDDWEKQLSQLEAESAEQGISTGLTDMFETGDLEDPSAETEADMDEAQPYIDPNDPDAWMLASGIEFDENAEDYNPFDEEDDDVAFHSAEVNPMAWLEGNDAPETAEAEEIDPLAWMSDAGLIDDDDTEEASASESSVPDFFGDMDEEIADTNITDDLFGDEEMLEEMFSFEESSDLDLGTLTGELDFTTAEDDDEDFDLAELAFDGEDDDEDFDSAELAFDGEDDDEDFDLAELAFDGENDDEDFDLAELAFDGEDDDEDFAFETEDGSSDNDSLFELNDEDDGKEDDPVLSSEDWQDTMNDDFNNDWEDENQEGDIDPMAWLDDDDEDEVEDAPDFMTDIADDDDQDDDDFDAAPEDGLEWIQTDELAQSAFDYGFDDNDDAEDEIEEEEVDPLAWMNDEGFEIEDEEDDDLIEDPMGWLNEEEIEIIEEAAATGMTSSTDMLNAIDEDDEEDAFSFEDEDEEEDFFVENDFEAEEDGEEPEPEKSHWLDNYDLGESDADAGEWDSDEEAEEEADWLADIELDDEFDADDEEEIDWLTADDEETGGEFEADEGADEFFDFEDEDGEDEEEFSFNSASVATDDAPDWLADLAPATEEESESADDALAELFGDEDFDDDEADVEAIEQPDWLSDMSDEDDAEEEEESAVENTDAWLSDLNDFEEDDEDFIIEEAEPADADWLAEVSDFEDDEDDAEAEPADEDWLSEMGDFEDDEDDAEAEPAEADWLADMGDFEDEVEAPATRRSVTDELDWMVADDDEEGFAEDTAVGASANLDFLEDLDADNESEMDWVDDIEDEDEAAVADETPINHEEWLANIGDYQSDESAMMMAESEEFEEKDSWLADIGSYSAEEVEDDEPAPEWLADTRSNDFDFEDEDTVTDMPVLEDEQPDWLSGMGDGDGVQDAFEDDDFFTDEDEAEEAQLDWLSDVSEDEEEDEFADEDEAEEAQLDWLSDVSEDEEEDEFADEDEAEEAQLDWLSDVSEDEEEDEFEDEADDFDWEDEEQNEQPDWLAGIPEGDGIQDVFEEDSLENSGAFDGLSDINDYETEDEPDVIYEEEALFGFEDEPSLSAETQPSSGLTELDYLEDFEEELEHTPADSAPDWLNAMVPGLDIDYEAEGADPMDEVVEESEPTQSDKGFDWLSDIVDEETNAMKPVVPKPQPMSAPHFKFSRRPAWMEKLLGGAATVAAVSAVSHDDMASVEDTEAFDDMDDTDPMQDMDDVDDFDSFDDFEPAESSDDFDDDFDDDEFPDWLDIDDDDD